MGLREQFEKYDVITDEDIARGIVYAWTLMVVADEKVKQSEMNALENFAAVHEITQPFSRPDWLSDTVGEALNVYKTEGQDALFTVVAELLTNTNPDTRRVLFYTLMQLACVDGDFTDRELDVLNRTAEMLDIGKRDVLMMGMLYATYKDR